MPRFNHLRVSLRVYRTVTKGYQPLWLETCTITVVVLADERVTGATNALPVENEPRAMTDAALVQASGKIFGAA